MIDRYQPWYWFYPRGMLDAIVKTAKKKRYFERVRALKKNYKFKYFFSFSPHRFGNPAHVPGTQVARGQAVGSRPPAELRR